MINTEQGHISSTDLIFVFNFIITNEKICQFTFYFYNKAENIQIAKLLYNIAPCFSLFLVASYYFFFIGFLFVLYFNGSRKCLGNKNQDTKINETMSKYWYFLVETNMLYAMDTLTFTWDLRKVGKGN